MTYSKNLEIEYLRGMSILLVLVSHSILLSPFIGKLLAPVFRYLSFGVGVDLFFCISGFVVSASFLRKLDSKNTFWSATSNFWIRRVFRLLPSAWLWVFMGILCSMYFNTSGSFMAPEQNLKSFATIATFTANFGSIYNWLAPNFPYWSLALEEQFYLLFPFFMLVFKTPRARCLFLLLLIAIQFPLRRDPFGDMTAQHLAVIRTDGFAWGILIYQFTQTRLYKRVKPEILETHPLLALLATLLGCLLITWLPAYLYLTPFSIGSLAAATALLVWLASYSRNLIYIPKQLRSVFLWLGSRSYSIYLVHLFAFRVVQETTFRYFESDITKWGSLISLCMTGAAILIVGILSEVSFRYVESPARRLGVQMTTKASFYSPER